MSANKGSAIWNRAGSFFPNRVTAEGSHLKQLQMAFPSQILLLPVTCLAFLGLALNSRLHCGWDVGASTQRMFCSACAQFLPVEELDAGSIETETMHLQDLMDCSYWQLILCGGVTEKWAVEKSDFLSCFVLLDYADFFQSTTCQCFYSFTFALSKWFSKVPEEMLKNC